eukprot:200676-Chlamydomonas_euryale.AAC.15
MAEARSLKGSSQPEFEEKGEQGCMRSNNPPHTHTHMHTHMHTPPPTSHMGALHHAAGIACAHGCLAACMHNACCQSANASMHGQQQCWTEPWLSRDVCC